MRVLTCGVVDENVQATKITRRIVNEFPAKGFVANIAGQRRRIDVSLAHEVRDFQRVSLFLRQIIDRDIGAFACEGARPMPLSPPVIRALRPMSRPEPR